MSGHSGQGMTAHFLAQSGFAVVSGLSAVGGADALIFDYYKDVAAGGKKGLAGGVVTREELRDWGDVTVFVSHAHGDHFNPVVFEWAAARPVSYVFSKDISRFPQGCARLSAGQSCEVNGARIRAFGSTDLGVSFYVEFGGKRIFHAGDLNLWSWKNEADEAFIKQAERDFSRELSLIVKSVPIGPDVAFFPVDARMGVDYCEGAVMFCRALRPRVFCPMHFGPPFAPPAELTAALFELGIDLAPVVNRGDSFSF